MFLGGGQGGCGAERGLEQEKGAGQYEAGLGASWLSGENIWLPSAPFPGRHYNFCKMEQQIFSRTLE